MQTPDSPPGSPPRRSALVRDSWGVGIATGVYGVSFGAISVSAGLSVLQTCVLSLVMFTGASQFAFVGVIAAGASPWSGAMTAALLGTRNTLYGLKLAPLLKLRGAQHWLGSHLVIDESSAMSVTRRTTDEARVGFWHTGGSVFLLWNLATLVGAVAGNAIGDPRTYGLDAAVGAAFLALLWPRLTSGGNRAVGLLAAGVALALAPFTAAGVPVLAAGGVALLAGLLRPADETGGER
ncbi:AzlC family ABC transporter permease [Nocardioides daphniae]|uniref:Branched-chain amino acid ABC transporter permease n=1 Tax=Nocardioides daphniae TaxID=402297 RepID=A0ABQ1Q7Z5_9ACTN|nr:AzlC family ABC transporter permease [Nocardioides daphniae]GGD18023.1 branched-chain amino acid ABC transporter permease [Nocardioides daphniae]